MATNTVETLVNKALRLAGSSTAIGSVYDGSPASRVALDLYGITRDELLKSQDWDFAQRYTTGVRSSVGVPVGWAFVLNYPSDCLKVRNVFSSTLITNDPRPALFVDGNAAGTPSTRYILSSVFPATIVYTGQVLDISQWDIGYTDAFIAALAERFVPSLGQPDMMKVADALADRAEMSGLGAQSSVAPTVTRGAKQ